MKKIDEAINNLGFSFDEKLLVDEYRKACKDPYFKDMVKELKIEEEKLLKRTSVLQECSLELKNCLNCKSILECKNKILGYAYTPMVFNDELIFNYVACKHKENLEKEEEYKKNIYLYDIPKEIREASLTDVYSDISRTPILKWFNSFMKNFGVEPNLKGLYLSGSFGCGKTYLVSAMFNELAKKGVKSAIIYFPEFLRDLKSSFKDDFDEKYDYIKKVPLLLLDDIGAENLSPWSRDEILGTILQYRMQERKPTFFTSNLNMEELENHFQMTKNSSDIVKARRIIERIKQLTDTIEYIGKNLRK